MGITSLLEPTFPAGVPGTVLGIVHSFILKYLLRYISEQNKCLLPWRVNSWKGDRPYALHLSTTSRTGA